MRIWNMIYAVYNGEAMDGVSEALGHEFRKIMPGFS